MNAYEGTWTSLGFVSEDKALVFEKDGTSTVDMLVKTGPLGIALVGLATAVDAQEFSKWCGKYYQIGAPTDVTSIPFGFQYPQVSSAPLLDFQCTPRSSFYLENDEQYDPPTIIIDANITYDVGQSCESCSIQCHRAVR